jgi:WD40 repeat protein
MRIIPVGFRDVSEVGLTPGGRTLISLGSRPMPLRCEWHDLTGAAPPRVYTRKTISWYGFAVSPHDGTVVFNDADELLEFPPGAAEPVVHDLSDGGVWKLAISPHAERMVIAQDGVLFGRNRVPIRLNGYSRKGNGWKRTWQHDGVGTRFGRPVFLPDGKRLAVMELRGTKVKGQFVPESTLLTLSTKGKVLHERLIPDLILDLAVCGDHFALGSVQQFHVLPLAAPYAQLTRISLGRKHLNVLCSDPHGRFLLTACGKEVLAWDPRSWKRTHTFNWQIGTVNCLAVSADGTLAAAGGDKGKVAVWDVE